MALEFGFYDSYDHDRLYNAENMNDIFEGVIRDGVYAGVGDEFHVKPSIGLQVTVGTGRAWFKMTWNKNRTMAPVNLDMPDPVYDRIDTLCIRVQKNILERRNDFFVYKGPILTNPQPPVIQNTEDTFYLPLANITVRANAEEILVSDIDILVGRDPCPYVTSILQQTDITDLFARWEGQFTEWWNGLKDALLSIESGDLAVILASLEQKVDKSDKATDEDISLNSDNKWMTPAKTKSMIEDAVGEGLDDIRETLQDGVVTSFNGRKGVVNPEAGDYSATDVGALPIDGGTLTGGLTIGSSTSAKNLNVTGTSTLTGNTSVGGTLGVTSTATFNGSVEMKSGVRLKGSGNYGSVLNFGDSDYVHISEPTDNAMEIKANTLNFVLNGSSGSANTNFKINGVNPFSSVSSYSGMTVTYLGASTITTGSGSGLIAADGNNVSISSNVKILIAIATDYGGVAALPWSIVKTSGGLFTVAHQDSYIRGYSLTLSLYARSSTLANANIYIKAESSSQSLPSYTGGLDLYGVY